MKVGGTGFPACAVTTFRAAKKNFCPSWWTEVISHSLRGKAFMVDFITVCLDNSLTLLKSQ
jgi:hypothetical protein